MIQSVTGRIFQCIIKTCNLLLFLSDEILLSVKLKVWEKTHSRKSFDQLKPLKRGMIQSVTMRKL